MTALQTELPTGDETADGIETAVPTGKTSRRRWYRRKDRKGLGSTEIALIAVAIVVVGILSALGISRIMSARTSAEHSALQSNIETVSQFVDVYWNQYAGDIDGRRKLTPYRLCQFINSQLGGEDINFRTLQFADANATPANLEAHASLVALVKNLQTVSKPSAADANCPGEQGDLDEFYADILVAAGGTNMANAPATANQATTYVALANRGTDTDDGVRQAALEDVGLLSTKTVWIAQYGTSGNAGTAGMAEGSDVPTGTDAKFDAATAGTAGGAEYIVIGGQAPDGASFCMIKVLDAANNDALGDYFVSRAPQEAAGELNSFATCATGIDDTGPNEVRRGDWPEPQ